MAHYRAFNWRNTNVKESMVFVGGESLLIIIQMFNMLIRNTVRNEYLKNRLQKARVERKRYMNQAKLAVLLFFVSSIVFQKFSYTKLKRRPEARLGWRWQQQERKNRDVLRKLRIVFFSKSDALSYSMENSGLTAAGMTLLKLTPMRIARLLHIGCNVKMGLSLK